MRKVDAQRLRLDGALFPRVVSFGWFSIRQLWKFSGVCHQYSAFSIEWLLAIGWVEVLLLHLILVRWHDLKALAILLLNQHRCTNKGLWCYLSELLGLARLGWHEVDELGLLALGANHHRLSSHQHYGLKLTLVRLLLHHGLEDGLLLL